MVLFRGSDGLSDSSTAIEDLAKCTATNQEETLDRLLTRLAIRTKSLALSQRNFMALGLVEAWCLRKKRGIPLSRPFDGRDLAHAFHACESIILAEMWRDKICPRA